MIRDQYTAIHFFASMFGYLGFLLLPGLRQAQASG